MNGYVKAYHKKIQLATYVAILMVRITEWV